MKTGRYIFIFLLLLILIIIYVNKCKNSPTNAVNPSNAAKPALKVNGLIIKSSPLEDKIFSTGTLISNDEVELRNEIAGKITAIIFKEGTRVKKGDLLVTLYNEDLLAQLKKLELQQEVYEKFESRQKDLLTVSGVSQQDYDYALNQLNSVKADIQLIKSNLSKTQIAAPFDGVIGLKMVSQGAYLAPNTLIATVQSITPMKLEFSLPEKYRSKITENSIIHFTTESAEGLFEGKIYAFEPKIDLKTRSVMVRAVSDNKDLKLVPGAFAHIEIPLSKEANAILIPTQAMVPDLKGQKVFICKNGIAEKKAIEIGVRNDSAIQVTSGLNPGDTLITTGMMQIRPGLPVVVSIE